MTSHRVRLPKTTAFFPVLVLAAWLPGKSFAAGSWPDASQLPARPELPDPLVMFDGQRVTNAAQWTSQRRPELKALFEQYMYGHRPPVHVAFAVSNTTRSYL